MFVSCGHSGSLIGNKYDSTRDFWFKCFDTFFSFQIALNRCPKSLQPDNTQLLCKWKDHCTADNLFYWFGFNQTSKSVDDSNVTKLLNTNRLKMRSAISRVELPLKSKWVPMSTSTIDHPKATFVRKLIEDKSWTIAECFSGPNRKQDEQKFEHVSLDFTQTGKLGPRLWPR